MKIGIDARLIDEKEKFGIGIYQDNLIRELANIDKKNEYLLFFQSLMRKKDDFPGPAQGNFRKIIVRIPNGLGSNIKDRIWTDFLLPFYIRKEKIDVFHNLCRAFPSKKPKCKTVVTIHDLTYKYIDLKRKPKRTFAAKSFERSVLHADKIITISESSKKDILKFHGIDARKIAITYNGLTSHIRPIPEEELQIFKKRVNLDYKFILYVGYFLPHKNVERIIESFDIARKRFGINQKLVLIGGGPDSLTCPIMNLIRTFHLQDEIIFKGYLKNEELNCFYNAADLFLFPTLYEGFGMPVLEAMAVGTPVITSNTSSLPEVAGDASLLVNPYNSNEIAEAIWRVINDNCLREDLIKKGFERIKNFTWRNTAIETLKVYQSLMN